MSARKNNTQQVKSLLGIALRIEALVGVEPTVADLQSAALATWLQRLEVHGDCEAVYSQSSNLGKGRLDVNE